VLDLELQEPPEPPPDLPPPKRPIGLWLLAVALLVAIGIAAYLGFVRRSGAPTTAPPAVAAAPPSDRPLGSDAAPIVVPPLAESDPVVRELVRQLSSHPSVAAWLATNGLIRNFTVSVENVADGATPARHLRVLRPRSAFTVRERGNNIYINPRSYERYDTIAAAVASIDPAGAARLYATLKPRIEEAHRELGGGATSFDRTLERAIVLLLETPVLPEGDVRLQAEVQGIGYGFNDPQLENLTAAQKQLLRMGPRNAATIQAALRAIAVALGIPAERLPRERAPR
jgi:Protein of unknown function (DUF3014)